MKIGKILHELCLQKGIGLLEVIAPTDHIHVVLSVPPKYCISMTIATLMSPNKILCTVSQLVDKE